MGPKREPPAPQRSPRQASISVDPVFGRLEAGNLLLVNGPRPLLELPELPIEDERDSYADDDDGETHQVRMSVHAVGCPGAGQAKPMPWSTPAFTSSRLDRKSTR